jgi:hypothetical protein
MTTPYFVSNFSSDLFSALISKCFESDFADIKNKKQVQYIVNYLTTLGAQTIVSERVYVDKDYSEDFSSYYVKSFKDYKGYCTRLHFFKNEFHHQHFTELVKEEKSLVDIPKRDQKDVKYILDSKVAKDNYLGFIVIKPLPFTFIGKTCLKAYQGNVLTNVYHANLFGLELSVDSIAFQEQDRVISACATTAVWSLLHALPERHNKLVPSPSAITLAAIEASDEQINGFPNKGLHTGQIISALEKFRLKHHEWDLNADDLATESEGLSLVQSAYRYINTYISSKIPLLVGLSLFKPSDKHHPTTAVINGKKYYHVGDHAVCTLGTKSLNEQNFIYVHDDRIGPYVELEMDEVTTILNTADVDTDKKIAFIRAYSEEILIPNVFMVATYPKKRIHLPPIINTCEELLTEVKEYFGDMVAKTQGLLKGNLEPNSAKRKELQEDKKKFEQFKEFIGKVEFSITLQECRDLKSQYFKDKSMKDKNILFDSLAHFIWKATFKYDDKPFLDLLFDGTDMPNGNAFIKEVDLDSSFSSPMVAGLKALSLSDGEDDTEEKGLKFVDQSNEGVTSYTVNVIRALKPNKINISSYLSSSYGAPKSPQYLKEQEVFENELVQQADAKRIFSSLDTESFDLQDFINENDTSIWVFDKDGALILGNEDPEVLQGHPTLTGSEPARIGGEIRIENGLVLINSKSGRYSGQYLISEQEEYLFNALNRFKEIFVNSDLEFNICTSQIEYFESKS